MYKLLYIYIYIYIYSFCLYKENAMLREKQFDTEIEF